MAEIEGLSFGIGIDTSSLDSGFKRAEQEIDNHVKRINREMQLIQLRGQIKLDGLDETAGQIEKVKIQEEALIAQMELQRNKVLILSESYEHLLQTRGANAKITEQVEMQLAKEQYAMSRLEKQTRDLARQTEIVWNMNLEYLGLIGPALKVLEKYFTTHATLMGLAPGPAKAAAVAFISLQSLMSGTTEATEELRKENPAKILDEEFQKAAESIEESWKRINTAGGRAYSGYSSNRGDYYRNNYSNNNYKKSTNINETKEAEKSWADTLGIKRNKDGSLKIFPDPTKDDFLRFVKVLEDYRPSDALMNVMNLLEGSDSAIGKLTTSVLGLGYTALKVQIPVVKFAKTAIENFKELSKFATELNLSLDKTNDFLGTIALTGVDYEDVRDYVRGVQDAVIKGDSEDPEVLALEKYGVVIQDTQGKLLAFDETLERLYQGYLKAREAGEAEAYVMMTNGQAIHDVLPYFEKLEKAKADVEKIQWSSLDAATLKEASNASKLLKIQVDEFNNAVSSLAAPIATHFLNNFFEAFKYGTKLIEENRDEIIYWAYVLKEGIDAVEDFTEEITVGAKDNFAEFLECLEEIEKEFKLIDSAKKYFKDLLVDEPPKDLAEEAKENLIPFYTELKKLEEEFGAMSKLKEFLPEGFTEKLDEATNNYLVPFNQELKSIKEQFSLIHQLKNFLPKELVNGLKDFAGILFDSEEKDSIFTRAQKDLEEFKKANEKARKEAQEKVTNYLAGLSYSNTRVAKYKAELENLNFEIQFGSGYSYEKIMAQNKLWYDTAMKDAKQYAEERAIIEELFAVKNLQVEQEREQKLSEIRERISAADKTELEKRISEIEREKESWIQAGMEKAEAEQLAQKQLNDYIKNAKKELSDNLQSLYSTELENRLAQIEKEKQAYIDKCGDEVKATQQAAQAKADAQRSAAMSVIKQQAEEYEAYQKGGYAGLRAYKVAQLIEQGINTDYFSMTPKQLAEFQKANQVAEKSMMPNFMTEHDRAEHAQQMQNWRDQQSKQTKNFDEENYAEINGVRIYLSKILGNVGEGFSFGKNDKNEEHKIILKPDGTGFTKTDKKYSYDDGGRLTQEDISEKKGTLPTIQEPENYLEILQPLKDVSESLSEFPTAVQDITENLSELPTAVQGITESLEQMPEINFSYVISEIEQSFSQIPRLIQEALDFMSFNETLSEVTVKINDLGSALENFISKLTETSPTEQKTPVNVSTNVSIEEAHAWDYNHIQVLAELVAEVLRPVIVNAIGGEENSY